MSHFTVTVDEVTHQVTVTQGTTTVVTASTVGPQGPEGPEGPSAAAFGIGIDGGGLEITTGIKNDLVIPYDMTITGWYLTADQTGSIVIDIWKDTYANFPPTVAGTITGTEKPTITASNKAQDLTLTSWTTTISAGDVLRFNVDSVTGIQRVTLVLTGNKT
jgi:hypothetical protein